MNFILRRVSLVHSPVVKYLCSTQRIGAVVLGRRVCRDAVRRRIQKKDVTIDVRGAGKRLKEVVREGEVHQRFERVEKEDE